MDLKAIEERNQMCLDQAIDEGWDEGDIARILFDEDVPALVARVKELEAVVNGLRKSVERRGYCPLCGRTVYHDDGVWQHNEDCALGALNPTESDKPSESPKVSSR